MTYTTRQRSQESYLNADSEAYADNAKNLKYLKDQELRKLFELGEKIESLKTQVSKCKNTIVDLRDQEEYAHDFVKREKDALAKVCYLIKKHDLHFDFNEPAYIENNETIDLENQEVYIDNWQDALDRCKDLTKKGN